MNIEFLSVWKDLNVSEEEHIRIKTSTRTEKKKIFLVVWFYTNSTNIEP